MIIAKKNTGFILITILTIVGFSYFVYDRIMNTTLLHAIYTKNMLNDSQAKNLIFAACSTAMLKLISFEDGVVVEEPEEEDLPGISSKTVRTVSVITHDDRLKSFYAGLLPILNSWQKLELKEASDGIDAKIYFCLTCEEGKISINNILDQKTKEFKPGYKEFFANFTLKNIKAGDGNLDKIIGQFLETKKDFLDDVTQLQIDEKIEFFYSPENLESAISGKIIQKKLDQKIPTNDKETSQQKIPQSSKKPLNNNAADQTFIPLCDLFTFTGKTDSLNPLLFSSSVLSCLGINEKTVNRQSSRFKKVINKIVKVINYKWKFEENLPLLSSLFGKRIDGVTPDDEKDLEIKDDDLPKDNSSTPKTTSDPITTSQKNNSTNTPAQENKEDKWSSLKKNFSKSIEPQFFSLRCLAQYNGITKQAVIVFSKQKITSKYIKECKPHDTPSDAGINSDKKNTENRNSNEQDNKKHASLYKRCFFIPDGFEIIRFYWL